MNNGFNISPNQNIVNKSQYRIELINNYISLLLELGKVRITFFVAFSTFIGSLLFNGLFSLNAVFVSIGVFLLASGSSALNHYQERELDKMMERTKNRPIPSGRISANLALTISVTWILAGLAMVAVWSNYDAVILGIIALLWYNVFYTPLKMKYAIAVVPGAVIGAIPPIIGWTAMGGYPFDPAILLISIFFFMWQIPHFWLLLMIYDEDYKSAGFPTLSDIFSRGQMQKLTYIWIIGLAAGSLALAVISNQILVSIFVLLSLSVWLVKSTFEILKTDSKPVFKKAFMNVNIFVLVVILLLTIDQIFH